MMASFKFEKLIIWQDAMTYGEKIYSLTQKFPKEEQFNLATQMLRASDSIALNISEGSILQTSPEFGKFLGYSIRSLAEVVTCLHKAKLRNYISPDEFQNLYDTAFNLMNMIIAFRDRVKNG